MESKDFIKNALKTEHTPEVLPMSKMALQSALMMVISCANVMDIIKKHIIYGKDVDFEMLKEEVNAMVGSYGFLSVTLKIGPTSNDVAVSGNDMNLRLLHAAIGMFTESGEMLEALCKQLKTGSLDFVNFSEELGDSDWYKAIAHNELGISEEHIRGFIIKKLAKRYPEKFTSEAALNRDLDAERQILEEIKTFATVESESC